MKEDLLKIINTYGVLPQLKYFQSEVFELNEAILNYENFKDYSPEEASAINVGEKYWTIPEYIEFLKKHIAEEIADVMVMLEQFATYYGITDDEISDVIAYKINRQLERIQKGE